jgi:predicted O-methyltransferase YrrM
MSASAVELRSVYLDSLTPVNVRVGYGELGRNGSLGYEGKRVTVQRNSYTRALSSHPPARILFNLGGRFTQFRCAVALNDDVPVGKSCADFAVLADGRLTTPVVHIEAGSSPRTVDANVAGAQLLELAVETSHWNYSHAVWIDPVLEAGPREVTPRFFDCLRRAEIVLPSTSLKAHRCIATVVSPGFEALADDMLGSLYANGACQDALLVLFVLGQSRDCARLASKYRSVVIPCVPRSRVNPMSKAILYSVARVVEADQYLCLDADMLILGSLKPVFSALEACPEGSILAVREGNGHGLDNLEHALMAVYGGTPNDRQLFLSGAEGSYSLVANDGIFAGSRTALLALDSTIRGISTGANWVDQRDDIWWRNQFIFNLALARLHCGVELDGCYNVQLHVQNVDLRRAPTGVEAEWHGRRVRLLHLSGSGRRKYPQLRGVYARVTDPLISTGDGDAYQEFLSSLQAWIGKYGTTALAWSFYGTSDARSARVRDSSAFPLFGLLHFLVRSNGCARVLETGTARGVSAACLASAVAHRAGACVVTFDPYSHPERADLWEALPTRMRACIESRTVDSLEGMAAAQKSGETYDAALLDSIHTEEHVWAEFQLASKLVCMGGLILIHDAKYVGGTVEQALRRIEAAGYGVTRLWTAECGTQEDDSLGLAVIENRLRVEQRNMQL